MSSTYTTLAGTPPVITALAWRAWDLRLLAARLAECPIARATTYYFSQAGSDTTGDGSSGNPWKTIAKYQAIHDAGSGNTAFLFRRGDGWKEVSTGTTPRGLVVTKSNVTIGDWGNLSLAKPVISAFAAAYSSSTAWVQTTGQRFTWERAEVNTVAWLREELETTLIYRKLASIAQVEAYAGSWWWDSVAQKIYVHPIDDRAPNGADGRSYEAVYNNVIDGIILGDTGGVTNPDGCRIHNIRTDGFGASTVPGNGIYGIHTYNYGTSAVVISEAESHYGGKHNIGHTAPTNQAGGITTMVRCRAGWTMDDTPYVAFAPLGGQEIIIHDSECPGGQLPVGIQPYAYGGGGGPFTAHANNNTTYPVSLSILAGNVTRRGPYQCHQPFGGPQNAPAFTDLALCRSWVVDDVFEARDQLATDLNRQVVALSAASGTSLTMTTPATGNMQPQASQWIELSGGTTAPEWVKVSSYVSATGVITLNASTPVVGTGRVSMAYMVGQASSGAGQATDMVGATWPGPNTVSINCRWDSRHLYLSPNSTDVTVLLASNAAILINCTLVVDFSQVGGNPAAQRYRGLTNSGASANGKLYNCRVHFRLNSRQIAALDIVAGKGTTATGMVVKNSILSVLCGGAGNSGFAPGIGNGGVTQQANNAYVGATVATGIGGYDQDPYAVLLPRGLPLGHPTPASPLLSANVQLVEGYRLEYDADWRPRSAVTPAIGPYEPLAAVSSGSGRVGILNGGAL